MAAAALCKALRRPLASNVAQTAASSSSPTRESVGKSVRPPLGVGDGLADWAVLAGGRKSDAYTQT